MAPSLHHVPFPLSFLPPPPPPFLGLILFVRGCCRDISRACRAIRMWPLTPQASPWSCRPNVTSRCTYGLRALLWYPVLLSVLSMRVQC